MASIKPERPFYEVHWSRSSKNLPAAIRSSRRKGSSKGQELDRSSRNRSRTLMLWTRGQMICFATCLSTTCRKRSRTHFLNGTKRRMTFRHGDYKFERDWRGALRAMSERIENPPSEKIKAALEELIAPMPCPGLRRQTASA